MYPTGARLICVSGEDHLSMKLEVEAIRTQLGPDWLQTLAAQKPVANQSSSPQFKTTLNPREATEDDLYLKGTTEVVNHSDKAPSDMTPEKTSALERLTNQDQGDKNDSAVCNGHVDSKAKRRHHSGEEPERGKVSQDQAPEPCASEGVCSADTLFYSSQVEHPPEAEVDYGTSSRTDTLIHNVTEPVLPLTNTP